MNGMLDDASQAWLDAVLAGDQAETDRLGGALDTVDHLEQRHRERPGATLDQAIELAAAGVPVFPIKPRGKQPLTTHGFKDASADRDVVAGWWQRWPDANLGMPTGAVFDVVDIDGTAGMVTMYGGDQPLADTLTVLGIALTSRPGGRHLYVPVSGRGNKTGLYPGVDYRGVGGYVVLPPSIGANGQRYQWLTHPLDTHGNAA